MVVAIIGIVGVIALPNMNMAIRNSKLRSASSNFAGLAQSSRMKAVKYNKTYAIRFTSLGGQPIAYSKDVTAASTTAAGDDLQVQLGTKMMDYTVVASGTPPAIDATSLSFTPRTYADLNGAATFAAFNARGMPCEYNTTTLACTTNGFVFYIKDTTRSNGWTAVSISPAGRVKQWFWNGAAWVD